MIIKSAEFVTSAAKPSQYPPAILPEVAFAGRSNVGKSSLINTLVNRKHLVKTSKTPGRTQLVNFFNINAEFYFVDLPGYGYAKVPDSIRKKWGPMVETYLSTRKTLKGVVLIMDIRRTPAQDELNFLEWLHQYGLLSILVLTKSDKLSKNQQISQQQTVAEALSVDERRLIRFSSKSRLGKSALWGRIVEVLGVHSSLLFP
jgi:GTP-binding protein